MPTCRSPCTASARGATRCASCRARRRAFDPANDAGDGALFVYGAGDRAPGEPREHAFDGIIDLHADRPADVVHLYVTDIDGAVVDPALLELGEVDVAATPAP